MSKLTIYKYPLRVDDVVVVTMRKGAQLLSIQEQEDGLYIWALVDPQADERDFVFRIFGTGQPVGGCGKYLATVQVQGFVWHVFEA